MCSSWDRPVGLASMWFARHSSSFGLASMNHHRKSSVLWKCLIDMNGRSPATRASKRISSQSLSQPPHKYCSNEPPNLISCTFNPMSSPHLPPENASNPQTKAQSDTIAPSCSSDTEQVSSQNNIGMAVNQNRQIKAKTIMTLHGF